jgi:hypothetical protein
LGEILVIAIRFPDYKKEFLELWWGLGIEIHVEDILES